MDAVDSGAARHSSGRQDAARLLAGGDSRPKSVGSRGVSQIRTLSFSQGLYGLLRQGIEPACGHILLKLLISLLGVERHEPGAQRRQILWRELTDSLFDGMHSTHRRVVFLLHNCLALFWEHMT